MQDSIKPKYKNKVYCKVKISKDGSPCFMAQDIMHNTASKGDILAILKKYGVENPQVFEDFKKFFKPVSTQLRFTGHPKTFLEQQSGSEFYDELIYQLQRFSRGNILIEDKEGKEKEGPISIFTLFQFWDNNEDNTK